MSLRMPGLHKKRGLNVTNTTVELVISTVIIKVAMVITPIRELTVDGQNPALPIIRNIP